jgi:hypothetical protein
MATPNVMQLKHPVISLAKQQMSSNRIAETQPCTVIGVDLRTNTPFSRGFASYQSAEQWLTSGDAANFDISYIK